MATVNFKLKPQLKERKTILVELYISRKIRPTFSTGETTLPANWNGTRVTADKQLSKGEASLINQHLSKIEADLMQVWRDNPTADKITITELALKVLRPDSVSVQKKTLWKAFEKFLKVLAADYDEKYVKKFRTLETYLKKFDAEVYPIDLPTMGTQFYYDFKEFLYKQPNQLYLNHYFHNLGDYWIVSEKKSDYPVGLFDDTVYKYIINLKTFMKFARKMEYEVHPSYPDWPVIEREYDPISLTISELERVEALEINGSVLSKITFKNRARTDATRHEEILKGLNGGRDYLVLECRIGKRISDTKRFDFKDFSDKRWTFRPYKGRRLSSETTTVYFTGYCEPALETIKRNNWRMPELSEQKINKNIRKVCQLAGIDKEMYIERWVGNKCVRFYGKKYEFLTSHTGRKTFITLGLQFMSDQVVMDLANITSYKTLKKYAGKPESAVIESQLNEMQTGLTLLKKNTA